MAAPPLLQLTWTSPSAQSLHSEHDEVKKTLTGWQGIVTCGRQAGSKFASQKVSSLEVLPSELKLLVLELIPDIPTLLSAIQASSNLYKIYKVFRQPVVTAVTLNELANRGINLLPLTPLLEICDFRGFPTGAPKPALKSLYAQQRSKRRAFHLEIKSCRILRRLGDVVMWDRKFNESGRSTGGYRDHIGKSPRYRFLGDCYRAVYLRNDPPKEDGSTRENRLAKFVRAKSDYRW